MAVQGVQLAQPLTNPYVVIGQLPAGALPVLVAAQLDQGGGLGVLIAQLAGVGDIRREMPTAQTRVALVARFQRGQQTHPVGQHPVSALGELGHVQDVGGTDRDVHTVGADLLVLEELGFGGGRQGGGIPQRHLR